MQIGSLVRMADDPQNIVGLVVEIRGANVIKVNWLCELCHSTFVNQWDLEVLCK